MADLLGLLPCRPDTSWTGVLKVGLRLADFAWEVQNLADQVPAILLASPDGFGHCARQSYL